MIICNMIILGKCWLGSWVCFICRHTLNSHTSLSSGMTLPMLLVEGMLCILARSTVRESWATHSHSLGGAWATGAGRARGIAEQLPAAMWLTLFKPEWLVFWMPPTQLKVMISGQANLFPDSLHAPKSKNIINSSFTKCILNTYYDFQ